MSRNDYIALSLIGVGLAALVLPVLFGLCLFMTWAEPTINQIIN